MGRGRELEGDGLRMTGGRGVGGVWGCVGVWGKSKTVMARVKKKKNINETS